jgi:AcrR family transcriptional regulator
MPNERKLEVVQRASSQLAATASATALRAAPQPGSWRADIDPRALPPTTRLTAGQRRVLAACVELFGAQGYAASSIRDIASAAGLQSASLYNHFPSKEAILAELVVLGHEHHLDCLLTAALNAPSDPREQLVAVIRANVLVHCEYANMGIVVNYELRHLPAEVHARMVSIRERSALIVTEILRRGAEQGHFAAEGHHVALLALASMGVDAARWFPYQTEIDAAQLADDFARLALRLVTR